MGGACRDSGSSDCARRPFPVGQRWTQRFRAVSAEALYQAIPDGWTAGKPLYNPGSHAWEMCSFDQRDRPKIGHRTRATAVAPTEERVVREMARCLREIGEGRVPKYLRRVEFAPPAVWRLGWREVLMSDPVIFISHFRIKKGMLEAVKELQDLVTPKLQRGQAPHARVSRLPQPGRHRPRVRPLVR